MISKNLPINFILVFIFFLSLTLSNVISSPQDSILPEPRYGGTLIDSMGADAQILNPILSSESFSTKIENFIFQSMMTYDKDMDIIPELAQRWEISESKLNYTFHLRKDVYWHDGEKLTAEDVIFTMDRLIEYEFSIRRPSEFIILDFENIPYEMIDEYTVIFHLTSPYNSMLNLLMFSIIPEHVYLNHDGVDGIKHTEDDCWSEEGVYTFHDDPANFEPIGTGCMMFFEWERDDHITLIRNSVANGGPGNWREHDAYLDRYLVRIMSDLYGYWDPIESSSDIDIMYLSSVSQEDINDLIADPNYNVYTSPSFTSDHIAFQTDPDKGNLYGKSSRDFIADPNHFAGYEWQVTESPDIYGYLVRQALNYAIDKQALIDSVYPQGSRNLGPMYLAQYEWYNEDVNPYYYNLTKANVLLEQAGFGVTADDPLRKELNFTISFNQGNLRREKTSEFARDQWTSLGINVEIENLEWVPMLTTHYDGRNFDTMVAGWTGGGGDPDLTGIWSSSNIKPGGEPTGVNSDGTWVWSGTPREGGLNYMSYWNNAVDLLMVEARTEEVSSVRKIYYDQIQEMIVDDSPYIWLLAHVNLIAVDNQFYGFVDDSLAGFWPEPIGFRNIYYAPEDSDETVIEKTSGFELFSVLIAFIGISFFLKKKK